jgi:hypothetical protein
MKVRAVSEQNYQTSNCNPLLYLTAITSSATKASTSHKTPPAPVLSNVYWNIKVGIEKAIKYLPTLFRRVLVDSKVKI